MEKAPHNPKASLRRHSTYSRVLFGSPELVNPTMPHLLEWSTQGSMSNLGQGLVVMARNSLQSIMEPSTNTLRRVIAHSNSKGHAPRKLLLSGSDFRKPSTRPPAYGSSGPRSKSRTFLKSGAGVMKTIFGIPAALWAKLEISCSCPKLTTGPLQKRQVGILRERPVWLLPWPWRNHHVSPSRLCGT